MRAVVSQYCAWKYCTDHDRRSIGPGLVWLCCARALDPNTTKHLLTSLRRHDVIHASSSGSSLARRARS